MQVRIGTPIVMVLLWEDSSSLVRVDWSSVPTTEYHPPLRHPSPPAPSGRPRAASAFKPTGVDGLAPALEGSFIGATLEETWASLPP